FEGRHHGVDEVAVPRRHLRLVDAAWLESTRVEHLVVPVGCPYAVTGTRTGRPTQHARREVDAQQIAQRPQLRLRRLEELSSVDYRGRRARQALHVLVDL